MRKYFRKAAISTICMLVVAIMSLTGATYAWFSSATSAEIKGFQMEIGAAGTGLQIAEVTADGTLDWGNTIDFEASLSEVQPSSTIDGVNFYTATVDANSTNTIVGTQLVADASEVAIIKQFRIRNTGSNTVTATIGTQLSDIFSTTEKEDSDEAQVINCARIALFDENDALVWAYGELDNMLGIGGVGSGQVDTKDNTVVKDLDAKFTEDLSKCTIAVPSNSDDDGYLYTIKVWLEGQDDQCNNKVELSDFAVKLNIQA